MNAVATPELVLVECSSNGESTWLAGIQDLRIPCIVTLRRDGASALEHLLDADEPPPKLIVLEYKLPRLSGIEILARLRLSDRTRFVPVVMLVGDGNEVTECYRCGANSCMTRPDDPQEYAERLAWIALLADRRRRRGPNVPTQTRGTFDRRPMKSNELPARRGPWRLYQDIALRRRQAFARLWTLSASGRPCGKRMPEGVSTPVQVRSRKQRG